MPLISIDRSSKIGFHIASCVSGNANTDYNTKDDPTFADKNGLTKGKWYLVEISQAYSSKNTPQGIVLTFCRMDFKGQLV